MDVREFDPLEKNQDDDDFEEFVQFVAWVLLREAQDG